MADARNPPAFGGALACPVCGEGLEEAGPSARCPAGHSFDFARSGYLNLAGGGGGRERVGDSAAMVRARERFLAAGHYAPLAAAVAEAVGKGVAGGEEGEMDGGTASGSAAAGEEGGDRAPDILAEIGSGTGYYLDAAARALAERGRAARAAIGVDLSKPAAERAAKLHPELGFTVADAGRAIPLRDAAASICLSVFAPRPGAELGRVLHPGGALIAAFAAPRHLERVRERLDLMAIEEGKLEKLAERLDPWFEPAGAADVAYQVSFAPEDARNLVLMGPNARHDPDLSRIDSPIADRVAVTVARFRRRGGRGASPA